MILRSLWLLVLVMVICFPGEYGIGWEIFNFSCTFPFSSVFGLEYIREGLGELTIMLVFCSLSSYCSLLVKLAVLAWCTGILWTLFRVVTTPLFKRLSILGDICGIENFFCNSPLDGEMSGLIDFSTDFWFGMTVGLLRLPDFRLIFFSWVGLLRVRVLVVMRFVVGSI